MAQTVLADIIFQDELRDYIDVNSVEQTAFMQSGIIAQTPEMAQLLAGPSNTFNIPHWIDLDASIEPNYSNDVYTDIATPLAVAQASMGGRSAYLNEGFSAMSLVRMITNQDPLEYVGRRLTSYWEKQAQRRIIAVALGIYNDNVANNGSDMVTDAGGQITAAAIIRARGQMGDVGGTGGQLSVIAMHSAVYTELSILNLIDFTPVAGQVPEFGRFQQMAVVLDDGLPIIPGAEGAPAKYLSIVYRQGAIGYADEQPAGIEGLEYDRQPDRGNGGGVDTLWTRRNFLIHPFGYDFTSAIITGTPSTSRPISANWSDLTQATNWERKFDRRQVPIAFITSTLAA